MTVVSGLSGRMRQKIDEIEELSRAILRTSEAATALLEEALKQDVKEAFQCDVEPTDHRREHRPGRVAKLDADPVLQAFVVARLDRLTFEQIADDVADHFPQDRRVGKSAIHAWWTRNKHHAG